MFKLHSPNPFLLLKLVKGGCTEKTPPFKQHRITNQLEPWCEFQIRLLKHGFKFLRSDVLGCLGFVGIDIDVDIGLDEKNVVD